LNGSAWKSLNNADTWIPTYTDNTFSKRDWVEIGDSRFGQSHIALYGYPGWGDDHSDHPYKGQILVYPYVQSNLPTTTKIASIYLIDTKSHTKSWEEYKQIAIAQGGRLATTAEAQQFSQSLHADNWIPTFIDGSFTAHDWVQVGNNHPGTSHVPTHGYPTWSDNNTEALFKHFVLIVPDSQAAPPVDENEKKKKEGQKPLPDLPEVNHAQERLKNVKEHPTPETSNPKQIPEIKEVTTESPFAVTNPPGFEFFETHTQNGNLVITITVGNVTIIDIPAGKYGDDVIFYWESNVRKSLHVKILPSQNSRLASTYEIKNSQTNEAVADVELDIEKIGEGVIKTVKGTGVLALPEVLPDGHFVLKFKVTGFTVGEVRGAVYANCRKTVPSLPIFLSKILAVGERRFVLSWSNPASKDLDLHLLGSDGTHVYYRSKKSEKSDFRGQYKIELDIDVRGGFGPETLTLTNLEPGVKYSILVHNFDHPVPLSVTGAQVTYFGSSGRSEVSVPNNGDLTSVWWLVGGLLDTGEFKPFNELRTGQDARVSNKVDFASFPWPRT